MGQSRPDFGTGFQVKVQETLEVFPTWLDSGHRGVLPLYRPWIHALRVFVGELKEGAGVEWLGFADDKLMMPPAPIEAGACPPCPCAPTERGEGTNQMGLNTFVLKMAKAKAII